MLLIVKIREILKSNQLIIKWFRKMRRCSKMVLYQVSPVLLAKLRFLLVKGKWPNLKRPQSFEEKLIWLMLYWRQPLKTQCGDKYTMRAYVKEHGLGHILPGLLGVYEKSSEIDFGTLPERFVLKCTHACGFNIICKDRSELDIDEAKRRLDAWMKVDFSKVYGEIHYARMKPRIICERYLDDLAGELPTDYKVYCFDGTVHCTMVCAGRGFDGHNATYYHYDREWKNKLPYDKTSLHADRNVPKPEAYEEIIKASEKLSKPFPFVRMDFYSINGKAVLGEITFTPADCLDPDCTDVAQHELGKLIKLPKKFLE